MPSIDADQCSLSAVVRSYLSWTIEWSVMNVAAVQDSTSSDSVQPEADHPQAMPAPQRLLSVAAMSRTLAD